MFELNIIKFMHVATMYFKILPQLGWRGMAYYHVLNVTMVRVDIPLVVGGNMISCETFQNQTQLGGEEDDVIIEHSCLNARHNTMENM